MAAAPQAGADHARAPGVRAPARLTATGGLVVAGPPHHVEPHVRSLCGGIAQNAVSDTWARQCAHVGYSALL